jgi:hypothetical protein
MRLIHYIIFSVLFVILSFLFDYHHTTFYKPQSTHTWRQSDCASFALNYYQYGRGIQHPRLHNRAQADGYMVGEFPGLYFVSGQLYKIFGVHEFIPRFICLLLFFCGLMALFKMTFDITNSLFFAYIIPLLFFSAPVLTYYGNNFLTDTPAFAFILMGWSSFMTYAKTEKTRSLYITGLCFAMAGLIKITLLMSVVGLGGLFLMEIFGWATFKKEEKLFKHPWHVAGMFAGIVLIVGLWVAFSIMYNQKGGSNYFLNATAAPWQIDRMDWFAYTIYRIFYFWAGYYFFTLTHYLIMFLTFFVLLGRRYAGNFLYAMTLLTFIGSFLILQLWYYQFKDHDYYIIPGYIFVVFLLLSAIVLLKEHFAHVYQSRIFRVVVVLFLGLNIIHAKSTIHDRYEGFLQYKLNDALYSDKIEGYLDNLNIDKNDLVISVPDKSPCSSLYLLNRPGFSEWTDVSGTPLSEGHIRDFIKRGAKYLIVHDKDYLEKENILPFKEHEIGDYKGIKIYDLKPYNN